MVLISIYEISESFTKLISDLKSLALFYRPAAKARIANSGIPKFAGAVILSGGTAMTHIIIRKNKFANAILVGGRIEN